MNGINRRALLRMALGSAALSLIPWQKTLAGQNNAFVAATPLGLPQVILARALADAVVQDLLPASELKAWKDPDQLRAWLARNEVMITAAPSNVAANLYNRGVPVVLMNVNIWGALGMLGLPEKGALERLEDLAGRHVGVPWRGDMPDLVFRYLLGKAGLKIGRDLKVTYHSSPFETVQMFVAQRVDAAVLPEPMRSATRLQSAQFGQQPLELDLQQEWARLTGAEPLLPLAGVICRRELLDQHPDQVAALQAAIGRAVAWVQSEPTAAARLGASQSPLSEAVFAGAIPRTTLRMVGALQAKPALETFFSALAELSPDFIGGKLPDSGFYLPDSAAALS